jgi:hypothetical protein
LELLVSKKYPIHSLSLSNKSEEFRISDEIKELNLAPLQELRLKHLEGDEVKRILDSVWYSDCSKFDLDLETLPHPFTLLIHASMEGAIEMCLNNSAYILLLPRRDTNGTIVDDGYCEDQLSDLREIPFPNVRLWKCTGSLGFLDGLDLSCAHELDLKCTHTRWIK